MGGGPSSSEFFVFFVANEPFEAAHVLRAWIPSTWSRIDALAAAGTAGVTGARKVSHNSIITLIASRASIARYPSGTPWRFVTRSNTRPGLILPSSTSGSSSGM
jgi:hypothetical protein